MVTLHVNGKAQQVDVPPDTPLLWVLRDVIGLTGTKFGCGMALCGACTVHLDGRPTRACITPISAAAQAKVTTIEAIGGDQVGKAVQAAWVDLGVPQWATARPARSCLPRRCSSKHPSQPMPTSTRRGAETSAGAARTREFVPRFTVWPRKERRNERAPRLD